MGKDYRLLKEEAIKLRKKGLSYKEIQEKINVAKSTLSYWLKSVLLLPEHRHRLYTKQVEILARGPQSQKERRAREVAYIMGEAQKDIALPLSLEAYRLFGVALYWAEGSKRGNFTITNSDPYCILFIVKWLERVFAVPPTRLKVHLNIYPQQSEGDIKKFWSELTGIPLGNFGKSFVKPPNKGYKKNILYYGTVKIRVFKGTDMRYKVLGWIKAVLRDIAPDVDLIQRRWDRLANTSRAVNLS